MAKHTFQTFHKTTLASLVSGLVMAAPFGVNAMDDNTVLPEAQTGECYAKVLVPAKYETTSVPVVVQEASEQLLAIPAKFGDSSERIRTKDASTILTVVEPEYSVVERQVLVSAARQEWVRDSAEGNVGASPGLLADLEQSGVALDEAAPGSCFYEHYKPATVNSKDESILVAEATETLAVTPAKYVESKKTVMTRPASSSVVAVPAVFETASESVLIEPAKAVWKKGTGPVQRIDHSTGEIMCRVEIPAVYKEYAKEVVKSPARSSIVEVPATFETIATQTLESDASETRTPIEAVYQSVTTYQTLDDSAFSWVAGAPGDADTLGEHTGNVICLKEVPAEYATLEQTLVKEPGRIESSEVAAVFKDVPIKTLESDAVLTKTPVPEVVNDFVKTTKVSDARLDWSPVLCETNMSADTVNQVQEALIAKGYTVETITGVVDQNTYNAIEQFQEAENLSRGGLTFETLDALGVEI